MKITTLRFLCGALLSMVFALNLAAQTQSGLIKAARVQGQVFRIAADGSRSELKNGDRVTETDTVATENGASVVLVFQNGSTVRVAPSSRLKIEEFKMDPLGEGIDLSKMTEEPAPSQTKLDLAFGEIVGDVKKLKGSSNYNIKTPVGAAGIRGTIYRIVFRPTGDGKAFNFQVTTAEGLVVFEGTTAGSNQQVEVPADQEIIVTVDVAADGSVTINTPVESQAISAAARTQISETVQQVGDVLKEFNFTGTGGTNPPGTPPPNTTPPEPTKPSTTLTSGAGG